MGSQTVTALPGTWYGCVYDRYQRRALEADQCSVDVVPAHRALKVTSAVLSESLRLRPTPPYLFNIRCSAGVNLERTLPSCLRLDPCAPARTHTHDEYIYGIFLRYCSYHPASDCGCASALSSACHALHIHILVSAGALTLWQPWSHTAKKTGSIVTGHVTGY